MRLPPLPSAPAPRRRGVSLALVALVAAAPVAVVCAARASADPAAGDGARPAAGAVASPDDPTGAPRRDGRGRRGLRRGTHRARRAMHVLRSLDLTDSQRALLADGRAAAEPVRLELRTQLAALFAPPTPPASPTTPSGEGASGGPATSPDPQAAKAARIARRAKVRELVAAARVRLEPAARTFVSTLSEAQTATLAAYAAKRGMTYDAERFTRRVAALLLAPRGEHGAKHGATHERRRR